MPLSKIVANSITDNTITTDQIADNSVHGRRNLIINGAMQVAQRGTTFTTPANGTDILDRFSVLANSNGASKVTYSQSTDAPEGFRNSLKLDVVTALSSLAASDYHILKYNGFEQQDIDHLAFGSSSAKQITMSFWVKSNKTGTLGVEFQYNSVEASGATVELAKLYTINAANTWEHKTLTWPAPTGHTSTQSAANGVGLRIYIWIAGGSFYSGGSLPTDWGVNSNRVAGLDNYLDSTSNEIYFTGFQLEAGDKATPFEHRSFAEELALCKRYYQRWEATASDSTSNKPIAAGVWNGSQQVLASFTYDEMRASPTFTASSTDFVKAYGGGFAEARSGGNGLDSIGTKAARFNFTVTTSRTAGQGTMIQMHNNGEYLELDAEL